MVDIRTIGDKNAHLLKKDETPGFYDPLSQFSRLPETQLGAWVDEYFSGLPEEVREGLEIIVKGLWANTKTLREIQPGETKKW